MAVVVIDGLPSGLPVLLADEVTSALPTVTDERGRFHLPVGRATMLQMAISQSGRIGEPRGSHIMKHAISLLAIAAAVCAPASALAQANVGGYYAPIPAPPPPVVYQSHYAPPGAYGAPGTYVYQSNPPPVVYRVPPVVYGYGNGQGGGWHRGWEYHRHW